MKKNLLRYKKWLSSAPFALAILLSVVLGSLTMINQAYNENQVFSDSSLQSMKELNFEYDMLIDDLSTEESNAVAELFHANAIISHEESRDTRGVLATLEEEAGGGVLLLQPKNELSMDELEAVADAYKSAIPEFEYVEVDQDLDLSGWPFFWKFWDKEEVELTEENHQEAESEPANDEEVYIAPVTVAVIDSGVDSTHEIFKGHTFTDGWNTLTHDTVMYDDVGHGTHIAGIIADEIPGVVIAPYKIVGEKGGKLSNVVEAFNKAIDDDVDVINTSFGVIDYSYVLEHLVNTAYYKGIVIVSAAGNNATDEHFYPASYDNTIAVAGVYTNGFKMPKSNYGDWVDIAARGYHVRSAIPGNSYGYKSGTSQATAFVSAAVADILINQDLELSFSDILKSLQESGKEIESGDLAGVKYIK
jgi:subtilisin family serine protease/cell division protein FtsL